MPTPYSIPIQALFRRVEEDRDFFDYINKSDSEAMELAQLRAKGFLKEAIWELTLKCKPDIDFYDANDVNEEFTDNWTGQEIYLVSSLMYQQYLERDIAKLKCLSANYTSSDLRVFDPSNARTTFQALFKAVCDKNTALLEEYKNKDRLTGEYKGIDYASYSLDDT